MNKKGITLIELSITMAIISFLTAVSLFSYQDWLKSYEIEKATKELYTDLMNARLMAMAKNREHFVVPNQNTDSYSLYEDKDEDGQADPGEELPTFPKKLQYDLIDNGSGKITFDKRGTISGLRTLRFESDAKPDYDCIKVSMSRIIMGRYDFKSKKSTTKECLTD